jgi:two-component system repressor protein LuxO
LQDGGLITADMLPQSLSQQIDSYAPPLTAPALPDRTRDLALESLLGLPLAEVERRIIEATLARHKGSVPKTARVLELSPSTLYRKIEGWTKQ